MFHILTDFHHRAARLMSQHKRRFHDKITDRSRFIVVQVTAADPQEYVAHEADLCFKLPDNVSTMEGALIA